VADAPADPLCCNCCCCCCDMGEPAR
jgi:hypothetical protein